MTTATPAVMRRLSEETVVRLVPMEGKDVVDVGSGSGKFCRLLRDTVKARSLVGVEPSEASLALAQVRGSDGICYKKGSGESIPLEPESADVAVFMNSFHHVGDMNACFDELYRVLRVGGVVVMYESKPECDLEKVVRLIVNCAPLKHTALAFLEPEFATGTRFTLETRHDFLEYLTFPSCDAMCSVFREVDPSYAANITKHGEEIARLFESVAQKTPEGQFRFPHPGCCFVARKKPVQR
eukprot:TRINITY_DN3713_c0_g1_i2.p1 TRINITY_DN3713_c0_g1~~TRINITY_DN3713_c0_g1_i2.p1  ORF type:complete len:263 (+),score=56.02 TRINITY_DN3713_c0_g1_i2:72-791(+)